MKNTHTCHPKMKRKENEMLLCKSEDYIILEPIKYFTLRENFHENLAPTANSLYPNAKINI